MINNAVLAILWDPNDHSTQKEDKEKWKLPRLRLTFLPKGTMYPFKRLSLPYSFWVRNVNLRLFATDYFTNIIGKALFPSLEK